jgi:hypothetical protein
LNADFNTTYTYDNINRLSTVTTQYAGLTPVQEAFYKYYANGKVQRLQLGTAQGVDYTYNERDWLQMINQQNITNASQDPGNDGNNGIPIDKFGEVIGYDKSGQIVGGPAGSKQQFNGNISWLIYQMSNVPFNSYPIVGNTYAYDNANRLDSANFGYSYNNNTSWQVTTAYNGSYTYDNVGNFQTLIRYGSTAGNEQDILRYSYNSGTNQVSSISGSSSATYTYDANGNVTSDTHRGIAFIIYDPDNMPVSEYLTNGIQIIYENDVNGSRVRNSIAGATDNFYFYGADGKKQ